MADTATLLPSPRFVAYDQLGNPLSAGWVYTYLPSSSTPKTTWQDAAETIPNANPIQLDSAGSCLLYGSGAYQITVTDALGNQVPAYSGLSTDASGFASASVLVSVVNIAALRMASAASLPQGQCYVLGYYGATDGGEGVFWYDAAATAADNGGTVIVDASGRRWLRETNKGPYSVKWFGAKGDSATDDYTAIQAAIDYCSLNFCGPIYFPPPGNTYKVGTGLVVNANGLRLVGGSTQYSLVQALTPDINLLTITGSLNTIENMAWDIPGIPTAVSTVTFANCVQCKILDCNISGGYIPLQFSGAGADNMIFRSKFIYSYGPSQVYMINSQGQYFYRCQFDQPWPKGAPAAANIKGAWTPTTAVTGFDVMVLNGYNIQCIGGGTTGATPPTILPYGSNFTDGGVTWQIAGFSQLVGCNIDTGSNANFFVNCDFTGAYLSGMHLSNFAAGFGPQKTWVLDTEFGEFLQQGILADAGAGLLVQGCTFDNGVEAGCAGVFLNAAWTSDASIEGCLVTGGVSYGFLVGGGNNATINGNQIFGCSSGGVYVGSNVNLFSICNNTAGSSPTWGTNAVGIQVAPGTSNGYVITGNNTFGATAGIIDGGTGGGKVVANNL